MRLLQMLMMQKPNQNSSLSFSQSNFSLPVQVMLAWCLKHDDQQWSGAQRFEDNQPWTVASGVCWIGRLRREDALIGDVVENLSCPVLKLVDIFLSIQDQLHLGWGS